MNLRVSNTFPDKLLFNYLREAFQTSASFQAAAEVNSGCDRWTTESHRWLFWMRTTETWGCQLRGRSWAAQRTNDSHASVAALHRVSTAALLIWWHNIKQRNARFMLWKKTVWGLSLRKVVENEFPTIWLTFCRLTHSSDLARDVFQHSKALHLVLLST